MTFIVKLEEVDDTKDVMTEEEIRDAVLSALGDKGTYGIDVIVIKLS